MAEINSEPTTADPIRTLLERRAQVQQWLQRLDDIGVEAESRVVRRVRADYEQRLDEVLRELGDHQETLQSDVAELRERLRLSGERHEEAVDALDEARLRNRIGEIGAEEWEERRPELEQAVAESEAARDEASLELARREELLAEIQDAAAHEATAGVRAAEPWLELPTLDQPDDTNEAAPADAPLLDGGEPQGGGFLEDLDRAIGAGAADGEEEIDTRPPPGVKCPDCGYTNDANAWYCGVCGVDLA